jgi:hypothetical protein
VNYVGIKDRPDRSRGLLGAQSLELSARNEPASAALDSLQLPGGDQAIKRTARQPAQSFGFGDAIRETRKCRRC